MAPRKNYSKRQRISSGRWKTTPKKLKEKIPEAKDRDDKSVGEELFQLHLRAHKIEMEREYKFHETRGWLFDFYDKDLVFGVEINGGIHMKESGHTGFGAENDYEKINTALLMGIPVLVFSTAQVSNGYAIDTTLAYRKIRENHSLKKYEDFYGGV